ncbi:hypothetical protein PJK55_14515 [Exiguobacterium sp. MMG028]|uniref:hypothetical protein n=1 Tax=Exiguobacterium sp. MMG028 TaxID=3021979 RepID=UPI0022FEAE6C|nr:hypothetical protein [Exiguobacterium sp. MMG028]MDA5561949.1 hypothetical protein [Exiguobacterium sp. MMG028]
MAEKKYVALFEVKDRVSPAVRSMTNTVSRARDENGRFVKKIAEMDKQQKEYVTTTKRTTESVDKMKRALSGVGRGFDSLGRTGMFAVRTLGGGLKGIASTVMSLPALIAGAGAAFGAWKLGDAVVGGAMKKELTQLQMGALLADQGKGMDLFKVVQDKAMTSMFSEQDFSKAATTFLPVTKDFGDIERMMSINERLASANLLEGMEGASFSLREALSGDITSIADRFNISKSSLRSNGFSADGSWQQNLAAVDKTLDKMGYTAAYVADVNDSAYAQWELFKSNSLKLFADSGEGILKKLKEPLKELNATLGSPAVARFVADVGDGLAGMFQRSLDYVNNLDVSWSDVEKWATETWGGAKELMLSAWSAGKELIDLIAGEDNASLADAFVNLGDSMEGIAATIDTIASVFDKIQKIGSWFSDGLSGKSFSESIVGEDSWSGPENKFGSLFKGFGPLIDNDMWSGAKQWTSDFFGFDPFVENQGRLRGSHRTGLSHVPYDGYVAELHQGERVLTKQEAQGSFGAFSINIQQMTVRQESDIHAIGQEIVRQLEMRG